MRAQLGGGQTSGGQDRGGIIAQVSVLFLALERRARCASDLAFCQFVGNLTKRMLVQRAAVRKPSSNVQVEVPGPSMRHSRIRA